MRPYSPGGALNALAAALRGSIPPTPSAHRLPLGLPGYLILFAPLAFVPERQYRARKPPSPLVFFLISTHFTATPGIPLSSPVLKIGGFECRPPVKPRGFHIRPANPPTHPLRPVNPNNACTLRITAAAGTELAGASSAGTVRVRRPFLPRRKDFTLRRASSSTRRRCVRLSPIAQDSLLLPPVGVWAVSQSQCGRPPSQVGYPSQPW